MSGWDILSFRAFCANATDEQLQNIFDLEVKNKRWKCAKIAREEIAFRGLETSRRGHKAVAIHSSLMDIEHRK